MSYTQRKKSVENWRNRIVLRKFNDFQKYSNPNPTEFSVVFWNIFWYIEILNDRYLNTQHHLNWSLIPELKLFHFSFKLKFELNTCLMVHKSISILYTLHIIHPTHLIGYSMLKIIVLYDVCCRHLSESVIFHWNDSRRQWWSMMAAIAVFAMDFYNSALDCLARVMSGEAGSGFIFLSFYFKTSFNSCFTKFFSTLYMENQ